MVEGLTLMQAAAALLTFLRQLENCSVWAGVFGVSEDVGVYIDTYTFTNNYGCLTVFGIMFSSYLL